MLGQAQAIGDLLPSAIAVALSPIPIIAVVLVLGAPNARTAGPTFALGWVIGLAAVSAVVVLALGTSIDPDTETGIEWFKVAVGILFLLMAAKQWRKRPRDGKPSEMPKWMSTVDSISAPRAGLLGAALLGANPKNLALTLAAAASIAEAGLDASDTMIAIAVYVALGSVTVVGSVLLHAVDPRRAARPLTAVKQFMSDYNAVIMMIVLLLLGAKLLGDGIAGVWS